MKKIDIDINKLDYLASRVISMEKNLPKEIQGNYGQMYFKVNEKMADNILSFDYQDKSVLTVLSSSDQMLMLKSLEASEVDVFDVNRLTIYYYYLRRWSIKYNNELYPNIYNNNHLLRLIKKVKPETELEANAVKFYLRHIKEGTELDKLFYDIDRQTKGDALITTARQAAPYVEKEPTFYIFNLFEDVDLDKTYDYIYISNILEWAQENRKKLMVAKENLEKLTNNNGIVICSNLNNRDENAIKKEKRIFNSSFERYDFEDKRGYVYKKR